MVESILRKPQQVFLPVRFPSERVGFLQRDPARAAIGHVRVDPPAMTGDQEPPVVRRAQRKIWPAKVGRGSTGVASLLLLGSKSTNVASMKTGTSHNRLTDVMR